MHLKYMIAVLFILLALAFCSCKEKKPEQTPEQTSTSVTTEARNPKWAVRIEKPGCPNLHKVSSALYRITVQGWTKDAAIEELTQGGFGWHSAWTKTLLPYLRDLDIKGIKQRAGVPE